MPKDVVQPIQGCTFFVMETYLSIIFQIFDYEHSGNEGHIDKFSFLRFFRFRGNFSAYIGTSFIHKHFKQL